MSEFHCLDPLKLERFLERRRARPAFPSEMSLAENLVEILRKANEFVPSDAGSILLDNPTEKHSDRQKNILTFIGAFGDKSKGLVGRQITASEGIAGHVYMTGKAYHSEDVYDDEYFYSAIDKETKYTTRSVVAVPIRLGQEVCGVLELINRQHALHYGEHDRNLLAIFAGYISISIQNVLDGRQAQEIAKRDNLTDLYNDRYLHIALTSTISDCRDNGHDLAVLFIDLDYFKRVNDSHGHLAGSQVLREVGHLLRSVVKHPHGIAARYGGDEFVLAIPEMDLTTAVDLGEEIRSRIVATEFSSKAGVIQPDPLFLKGITCSVGVATLKRHLTDEISLDRCKSAILHLADAAMYVAKETGRNRTAVAGEPVRRRRFLTKEHPAIDRTET